jgi:hypothetical protein
MLAVAPAALGLLAASLLLPGLRRSPTWLATCWSVGVTAVMLAYHLRPDGTAPWEGDAVTFHRMAEEWPWRPSGWWRYRILVPWLVKTLPGSVNAVYALLGLLSVAAAGPVLSLLLRDLGFSDGERNSGTLLYLAGFAPLYNTYNYAMPDPAAMLVLLLACRALVRDRPLELAAWLVVGCVTKEVVLFLVPTVALWEWMKENGRLAAAARRTVLVALPAGILFLGLRASAEEASKFAGFVGGNAWLFPWKHQPDNVARLFSPFGAGWALVFLAAWRPDRWAKAAAGFAFFAAASLLVTDSGRMLIYLLPFAVPMMLLGARGTGERLSRPGLVGLLLVALSTRLWEPFLVLWKVPENLRRGLALLLVPVVVILVLRGRRAGGVTGQTAGA